MILLFKLRNTACGKWKWHFSIFLSSQQNQSNYNVYPEQCEGKLVIHNTYITGTRRLPEPALHAGKEREEWPVLRKTKAGELTASRELKNETEENLRGNKMNDDIQKGERAREMRDPELHWSTKVRAAPILMTDSKCNNSSMCSLKH